jgi:hypothetical protein
VRRGGGEEEERKERGKGEEGAYLYLLGVIYLLYSL